MHTPLGLRRHLLITFPEIRAATVSMLARHHIAVRYIPSSEGAPDDAAIREWVHRNRLAHVGTTIERVEQVAESDLPAAVLKDVAITQAVAEDAALNVTAIVELLRRRWLDAFVRLQDVPGRVTCVVAPSTPVDTQAAIERELSHLLHGVTITIELDKTNQARPHVESRAELALSDDWDRMHALCDDAVAGRHQPEHLPQGAFAFLPLVPTSLFCHLAISGRVYVEMPRTTEEMSKRYGVPWLDFLDAMSTGRVVPVFRLPSDKYERGMVDVALDAGGHCILPGDTRLRELAAFVRDLPSVGLASQLDDDWRVMHAAVRGVANAKLVRLFDAIAAAGARARVVARREEFMAKTWAPIAFAIDDLLRAFGAGRGELEVMSAMDAMTAAHGCGTRPIVSDRDLIGRYVTVLYGERAPSPDPSAEPTIVEPPIVSKVILDRIGGISLRQFAESFDSAAIRAMHQLIHSPRVAGVGIAEIVAEFEKEMHTLNGRRKALGAGSIAVDAAVALAGLSPGAGLIAVAVTLVSKKLVEKLVLTDEQMARLLGPSKEAAYLARIDASLKNH
jgi:hypothetical protein